tara:strand:+ start:284 stop:478 length:195 start_codon:yes stop_codon:yes gene_type:complete
LRAAKGVESSVSVAKVMKNSNKRLTDIHKLKPIKLMLETKPNKNICKDGIQKRIFNPQTLMNIL